MVQVLNASFHLLSEQIKQRWESSHRQNINSHTSHLSHPKSSSNRDLIPTSFQTKTMSRRLRVPPWEPSHFLKWMKIRKWRSTNNWWNILMTFQSTNCIKQKDTRSETLMIAKKSLNWEVTMVHTTVLTMNLPASVLKTKFSTPSGRLEC